MPPTKPSRSTTKLNNSVFIASSLCLPDLARFVEPSRRGCTVSYLHKLYNRPPRSMTRICSSRDDASLSPHLVKSYCPVSPNTIGVCKTRLYEGDTCCLGMAVVVSVTVGCDTVATHPLWRPFVTVAGHFAVPLNHASTASATRLEGSLRQTIQIRGVPVNHRIGC